MAEEKETIQIATNREQSRTLILECNLGQHTADMCRVWRSYYGDYISSDYVSKTEDGLYWDIENECEAYCELIPKTFSDFDHSLADDEPAWSLPALLALLPDHITDEYGVKCEGGLHLCKFGYEFKYEAPIEKNNPFSALGRTPFDCCVAAIKYLVDNEYELNKI